VKRLSPLDAAWLLLESRDTPMHIGGLFEFTMPKGAGDDFLAETMEGMREERVVPPPWNLRLVDGPLVGHRLPLMREERDVDLDYHVRRSALPHPGGQRELGILVSRLHSIQLDLHRPLWEMHLIEGLEKNRFAMYIKMHHSLIDGVSAIRMLLRTLSRDPDERGMGAFWTVGSGRRSRRQEEGSPDGSNPIDSLLSGAIQGANAAVSLGKAGVELGMAALDDGALSSPYTAPESPLGGHISGQRRFATQQYDLEKLKRLAKAADCTLNDLVLYLSSAALRRYLGEHGTIPARSLTAGIPVNLRDPDDESTGNAIGMLVADLGTDIPDTRERIKAIKASVAEAKRHQRSLPPAARTPYTLLINTPYIASLMAGLGGHAPVPFNVTISNVPGPTEPLYFNGARLDALSPLSLLLHGNALNITCLSYAGTLNFGFTGARDTLPHLQRLAVYMGDSLEEAERVLLSKKRGRRARGKAKADSPAKAKASAKAKGSAKTRGSGRAQSSSGTSDNGKPKSKDSKTTA
jgi:diacylglycerol O-acyltransferase